MVLQICENLDEHDLKQMRLVSRAFDAVAAPALFQEGNCSVGEHEIIAELQLLEQLARSTHAHSVRTLFLLGTADEDRTQESTFNVVGQPAPYFERILLRLEKLNSLTICMTDAKTGTPFRDFHDYSRFIFWSLRIAYVSIPSLKHLHIQDICLGLPDVYRRDSRVEQLRHEAIDHLIANAPTLQNLKLACRPNLQFPLGSVVAAKQKLTHLELNGVEVQGAEFSNLLAAISPTLIHFVIVNSYIVDSPWEYIFTALLSCRQIKTMCLTTLYYHDRCVENAKGMDHDHEDNPLMNNPYDGDMYALRDLLVQLQPQFAYSLVSEERLESIKEYVKIMSDEICSLQEYREGRACSLQL